MSATSRESYIRRALIDGFVDGKINAVSWRRCVQVALEGLPADQVPPIFDDVMPSYQKLLKDPRLQTDPGLAERLAPSSANSCTASIR